VPWRVTNGTSVVARVVTITTLVEACVPRLRGGLGSRQWSASNSWRGRREGPADRGYAGACHSDGGHPDNVTKTGGTTMEPGERLLGKIAIVTGGASGIGAETARTFARHGASVVLCDLQDELGLTVAGEIVAAGGAGEYRRLDVIQEDGWTALAADVEATYGRIDVLCNIAGIASGIDAATGARTSMALPGLSLDSWNQVMAVNAAGVFLGTKAVHPAMKRAGGGSIVNISSICGIVGSFGNAAYNASKGAVRIFSKSAALQYAKDLIRVNSVHPGFVDTPLARPGLLGNVSGKARMDATPLGRFGKPSDIALGCLYLASDDAAWVTGSELVIDGGMTAN
jgi:NAD(P)-dependent dehydrogenase (short-subunit alcohol dehydrogenase family)